MTKWTTEILAISNETGDLERFCGQTVDAPTYGLAVQWCRENAGYLHVTGRLVAEIDINGHVTDYETYENN
jgi:hypothetical protein